VKKDLHAERRNKNEMTLLCESMSKQAKGLHGKGGRDDDYVTKIEFRMLLVYLKQ